MPYRAKGRDEGRFWVSPEAQPPEFKLDLKREQQLRLYVFVGSVWPRALPEALSNRHAEVMHGAKVNRWSKSTP